MEGPQCFPEEALEEEKGVIRKFIGSEIGSKPTQFYNKADLL